MERINSFKCMSNEELGKCYHSYVRIQINKEKSEEPLEVIAKQYRKDTSEKAAYPVMYSDMFNEIARRYCKIMGDLKCFNDIINMGMTDEYLINK